MKLSRADTDYCDSSSSLNDSVCVSCSSLNDDVCDCSSRELWWDNSDYYKLFYDDTDNDNEAITSSEEEEEAPDVQTCREERVIDAATCREERVIDAATCREESVIDSSKSESMFSTSTPSEDMMIKQLIAAMMTLAPSSIYDKKKAIRKRKKRMTKMISPELLSIWDNAATIVSPSNSKLSSTFSSFPSVDWKSVNKRFLTNIPSPTSIPIHGCSSNPDDYEDIFQKNDYGGMQNLGSKFTSEFPFGSELGYLTDAGPVGVPNEVFHGYKYQPSQGWLLHAEFPRRSEMSIKKRMTKRSMRRKKG